MIFARAPNVKGSTVRNKLDLRAVVAVCWKCDRAAAGAGRGRSALATAVR